MINRRPEEETGLYDEERFFAVAVYARIKEDGEVLPLTVEWEGRALLVEQILDKQAARMRKDLRSGTRFLIRVEGRVCSLFLDRDCWYLDLGASISGE